MSDPRSLPRSLGTVALFVIGVAAGVLAFSRMGVSMEYGPYPPRTEAAEPEQADHLADLLEAGDDAGIAATLDGPLIEQLSAVLRLGGANGDPLIDITRVQYLGTVADGPESVASYVVMGAFSDGTEGMLGMAIRVRDGEVVGIN